MTKIEGLQRQLTEEQGLHKITRGNWEREKTVAAEAQTKLFAVTTDLQTSWKAADETKTRLLDKLDKAMTAAKRFQGYNKTQSDTIRDYEQKIKQLEGTIRSMTTLHEGDLKLMQAEVDGAARRVDDLLPPDVGGISMRFVVLKKGERAEFEETITVLRGMCDERDRRLAAKAEEYSTFRKTASDKLAQERAELNNAYLICRERNDKIMELSTEPEREEETPHETTYVLDRARELCCSERAAEYGLPDTSFGAIALAWEGYRIAMGDRVMDGRDVAQHMIMFKAIRDGLKRKIDNLDDQASYAQCAAWITLEDEEEDEDEDHKFPVMRSYMGSCEEDEEEDED